MHFFVIILLFVVVNGCPLVAQNHNLFDQFMTIIITRLFRSHPVYEPRADCSKANRPMGRLLVAVMQLG